MTCVASSSCNTVTHLCPVVKIIKGDFSSVALLTAPTERATIIAGRRCMRHSDVAMNFVPEGQVHVEKTLYAILARSVFALRF